MAEHTFIAEPDALDVRATYIFDKPVEQVFAGYTNPELLPKWWIDPSTPLRVEKMDVRDGGEWRFINVDGNEEYLFRGVYHTVKQNERIVATWAFDLVPSVALHTITFESLPDGKTKLSEQLVFQSVAERQGMMDSGVTEESITAMMDRLAALL